MFNRNGEDADELRLQRTAERTEYWIRNWMPHKLVTIQASPNYAYYHSLNGVELRWLRSQQKRLFTIIYQLVLGTEEGPRLPWLIQAAGEERMLNLLDL